MKADFHLHTSFSGDSETPMADMIEQAISLDLNTICFTEHFDHDFPSEYGDFSLDVCSYYERFQTLKKTYASRIEVLFGVELGMQSHLGEYYDSYVRQLPFDYVIVSQHLVNRVDPYFPAYWEDKTTYDGIAAYFSDLYTNLKQMKNYDTLGHLDYIVRYAPNLPEDYGYQAFAEYIDPILLHLIEQNKCLEINSTGLRYGLPYPNPTKTILQRYLELGGKNITVGSDGHLPPNMAFGFSKVEELLHSLGFQEYCIFRNRQMEYRKLNE